MRFHDSGIVAVGGWVQMMLIGQLVLAYPVVALAGPSVVALQLLVGVLGVVFLVSSYVFLRGLLSAGPAALAVAVVGMSVPYALLSTSFMTDVPAAAFQLLALALALPAVSGDRLRWGFLLASSVTAVLAFSIREYALAALAAIWITVVLRRGRRHARALGVWTLILALVVIAMLLWRAGQVTVTDSPLGFIPTGILNLAWWPLMFGWLLLPVVVIAHPLRVMRAAWAADRALTIVVPLLIAAALVHTRFGLLGNYLSMTGGYAEVIRGVSPNVLAPELAIPLTIAAALSALLLGFLGVIAVSRTRRSRLSPAQLLAVMFVCATALLLAVVPIVASVALFDRYFLAVLPVIAGLTLALIMRGNLGWSVPWRLPAVATLLAMAMVSAILASATAHLDGARTALAAATASKLGVGPGNVDGGFDYYNANGDGSPRTQLNSARYTWWTARLAQRAVCATLTFEDYGKDPRAAGPGEAEEPIDRVEVRSPLAQTRTLVVYAGPDPC
jgi:rhodanese-related sulfurtransferase